MKRPEQQIQRAVFEHCRVRGAPNTMFWHTPNGGYRRKTEAKIIRGLGIVAGIPDVLAVKERVLDEAGAHPRCSRTVVPADLTSEWLPTLFARGFDHDVPTAWLVEGLLVYLTPADAQRLLSTVTGACAPGTRIAFERGSRTDAVTADDTAGVAGLWQGGVADPAGWLAAHGWDVAVDGLGDVATRYGRAPSRPTASGFIRAVRT